MKNCKRKCLNQHRLRKYMCDNCQNGDLQEKGEEPENVRLDNGLIVSKWTRKLIKKAKYR